MYKKKTLCASRFYVSVKIVRKIFVKSVISFGFYFGVSFSFVARYFKGI